MELGYELKLEQQQKLIMTPELLQAIQVLQYNSNELDVFVKEQLLSNPALEQDNVATQKERLTREDAIMQFVGEYGGYRKHKEYTSISDEEEKNFENYVTQEDTLYDVLRIQLQIVCKDKVEEEIGEFIIESLDENGYMTLSIEEISKILNKDEKQIIEVLEKIQQFEPAGIAATDLADCIRRQLIQKNMLTDDIDDIITNHLQDLADNKMTKIAKEINKSIGEVQDICDIIRELSPKPGAAYSSGSAVRYITPDIFVIKNENGEYTIEDNQSTPELMLSPYYEKLLRCVGNDDELKEYLSEKIESAIRLIKSINQRKQTINNVTKAILKFQGDFFENGEKYLKTLTLKQVAEEVGIHESTVSRSINGKYLQCARGVYELKYFFSSGVVQNDGEGVSSNSVKVHLKEIISNEDSKNPLSDQKLVELLKEKGMEISRRTVAKYRDEMNIPSSSKRKRY